MKSKAKEFDCIQMKRCIQERIYEETKHMDHREFAEHMRQRIRKSRFASFLERPIATRGGTAMIGAIQESENAPLVSKDDIPRQQEKDS